MTQILGNLPKERLEVCRPFYTTGIDFCGPFSVRYRNQRKDTYSKVYVCIFVCFTTKAVHFEIVEDATTASFLACLKRFFNRRGRSATIWSDNGSNFVGACNKLLEIEKVIRKQSNEIASFCCNEGVQWKFIPPRTPSFGGLWESNIKILKNHLKRVVGSKIMTLEWMYTLVVEIEGVMNSRPLTELSSDPNDLEPLTPGHFLTGAAISSIVEPDITQIPVNRLNQWRQITQMLQHFWKRFRTEYIQSLQNRKTHKTAMENLKIGELVIIAEDNLPPTHWLMGRVIDVFPGADGKVRCAMVKTKQGEYKRGIVKLARLPINE